MHFIDLHCDTLMHTWQEQEGQDIVSNQICSIDLNRLVQADAYAQFFAIFMLQKEDFSRINRPWVDDWTYIHSLVQQLHNGLARQNQVRLTLSYQDLLHNIITHKVSAFLTLEDGRPLEGDIHRLDKLYKMGIRLITLTWNFENSLGFPNSKDPQIMSQGLKDFGFEVVEEMNRLGMIIDVSHLSDGGFFDVIQHSKKPITASHSNARQLAAHPRNLTDEMMRLIADNGGIIGLNFFAQFLSPNPDDNLSRISHMVDHLEHMRQVAGMESLALGSDFDGIDCRLEIASCDQLSLLFQALDRKGWTGSQIEAFAYGNALRFLQDVL